MELIKRNGLLSKFVFIILIAVTIAGCFPTRPAEAAVEEIIAAIVIAGCEAALQRFMPKLKDAAGDSLSSAGATYLHEAMLLVEMGLRYSLEMRLYDLDHEELEDNAVKDELAPFLSGFYAKAELGFDTENPGYRNVPPGSAVIFSRVYQERLKRLLEQGKRTLSANIVLASSITDANNPAGVDTIRSVHEALMEAGNYLKKGYREMLQAESQTHTMSNKQTSTLRAAESLLNDEVIRYAQNERQEKADKAAAFEQAVMKWNPLGASSGY
jgi:hypothetical protein